MDAQGYRVYILINAEMSDCPASYQSGTGMNKNDDAGTSPAQDVGMPMPEASASMPIPSYGI
jgi:hypothetical protein